MGTVDGVLSERVCPLVKRGVDARPGVKRTMKAVGRAIRVDARERLHHHAR